MDFVSIGNSLNVELNIDLTDPLTPDSFSTILIHMIKYIAYNSQQIPCCYEGVSHLVKSRRIRLNQVADKNIEEKFSYNQRRADTFFNKVSEAHDNYENTFQNLLLEVKIPNAVEEIMIVLGDTLFNPKCQFRLRKPLMDFQREGSGKGLSKSLHTILRSLLSCSKINSIFSSFTAPCNMFILMELSAGKTPVTEWFIPVDDFVPTNIKKEVKIYFNSPFKKDISEPVMVQNDLCSFEIESDLKPCLNEVLSEKVSNWYRTKEVIKGFTDFKIEGSSVFNYLLKL